MTDGLHVITGGPGAGKSTLIEALAAAGLRTMPEAGRSIIQDQLAIGGSALPWADRMAFIEMMLGWELRSHREARMGKNPVVFDRGLPDLIGYLRLCRLSVPAHIQRAAERYRYNEKVFLAPFWPEIFTQDEERKQTAAEAEATCEAMAEAYRSLGYELVVLPLSDVADRAHLIRSTIAPRSGDRSR